MAKRGANSKVVDKVAARFTRRLFGSFGMVRDTGKLNVMGEVGRHYGRHDLDRVGFFDDPPSGPFDKYVKASPTARNDLKGKQLLAGQPNDFFDKTFRRIFNGEALRAAPQAKKGVDAGGRDRVMLPPSPGKLHSTPNDWFGCIGKSPDYFSPEVRKSEDTKRKRRNEGLAQANFKIKPNPLGGPGYVDICLNPYPKHLSEPYDVEDKKGAKGKVSDHSNAGKFLTASAPLDYFPPNPYVDPKPGPTYVHPAKGTFKTTTGDRVPRFYVPFPKHPGGQHAGCFNKFPGFLNDPYREKMQEKKKTGPKFLAGGPNVRTKYTNSIINQITGISCNAKNYREYRERVYPLQR